MFSAENVPASQENMALQILFSQTNFLSNFICFDFATRVTWAVGSAIVEVISSAADEVKTQMAIFFLFQKSRLWETQANFPQFGIHNSSIEGIFRCSFVADFTFRFLFLTS